MIFDEAIDDFNLRDPMRGVDVFDTREHNTYTEESPNSFTPTAEDPMERPRSGDEAEDLRRRSHVEHLVEFAKLAVRAADHTSRQIEDRARRRQGA